MNQVMTYETELRRWRHRYAAMASSFYLNTDAHDALFDVFRALGGEQNRVKAVLAAQQGV